MAAPTPARSKFLAPCVGFWTSLSCSEFYTKPVSCRAPLCCWLLGAVLGLVALRVAPTLMSAGVPEAARGEGWIGRQQVVSLLLFPPPPSSPFSPLSPTPKSSSWGRNCVFPQRVSVLLGMLVGVAFGGWSEVDRSHFRGKVSVLSICGICSSLFLCLFSS